MRNSPLDTGTQYAGLTPAERAAAAAEPHMSICDLPTIDECLSCRGRLRVIREVLAAARPVIAAEGYTEAAATLADVADRTGSPAARWAADYLTADPDRRAPGATRPEAGDQA